MTSCGRFLARDVITTDNKGNVTCKGCLNWLERRKDVAEGQPATAASDAASSAPSSSPRRSEAEAPPATGEAMGTWCRCGHAEMAHGAAGCEHCAACRGFQPATGEAEEPRPCGACGGPLPSYRDAVCEKCVPEADAHAVALSMAPDPDPVGSLSDGLATLPGELRPCCPDAGDWRCHGQAPGGCGCRACRREDEARRRLVVRVLKGRSPAALCLGTRCHARREFARLVRNLRGRAAAAERRAAVAERQSGRLVAAMRQVDDHLDVLEALTAGQRASLDGYVAELTATQNQRDDALARVAALEAEVRQRGRTIELHSERVGHLERERDDALMQASAAAERAHRAEKEMESLRALGRFVAEVEAAEELSRERAARDAEDEP